MTKDSIPQFMLNHDAFSQWLGIKINALEEGMVELEMLVRKEMTNGFEIAHGGISYSLADSALAFASNQDKYQAVSLDTNISHLVKVEAGDILRAFAQRVHQSRKIGVYEVKILNQRDENVAVFKGTVYISAKEWQSVIS